MAKGESLDALLSPCLRVSRPIAACSRCRAAKIKCDGKLPACTACERSGKSSNCSGASDEFAKGKERSYVAALEAALERLQRRITEAKALQAMDPNRSDPVAATYMIGPLKAPSTRRMASGGRIHRKEASDVDNLVGDFGFLSVNATSRDFHGFTATMSFARLLLSASQTGDIILEERKSLPPRYAITPLIQQYLDNFFVLMPFFSETDFMTSVSAVYADVGRHVKAADHWMVRMVLAIATASCAREIGDANYRIAHGHLSAALDCAEDVLHPGSIAGIQAILLLLQYSLLDPTVFSAWQLIGFGSRIMVDLGLHNEPAAEVRITKDELEMRRRVFYCVYAFDRCISMCENRGFSFTDDSISVELPVIRHSTLPSDPDRHTGTQLFLRSLRPSLYLYDIRRVQSSVYQETHMSNRTEWPEATASSYTKAILADIRSWFSDITASYRKEHVVFFRLESLYSQILTLAPSCRIPKMTELSKALIFEYAIQYADQLYPVVRDNNSYPLFSLTDASRVGYIGRQFRDAMWESFENLISGAMPRESPVSSPETNGAASEASSPPSPGIPRPASGLENARRAVRFLKRMVEILAYAQNRFGEPCAEIQAEFVEESALLVQKLSMKLQELGTVQYITGGPQAHQQQQQHQQVQQSGLPSSNSISSASTYHYVPPRFHQPDHGQQHHSRPQTGLPHTGHDPTFNSSNPAPGGDLLHHGQPQPPIQHHLQPQEQQEQRLQQKPIAWPPVSSGDTYPSHPQDFPCHPAYEFEPQPQSQPPRSMGFPQPHDTTYQQGLPTRPSKSEMEMGVGPPPQQWYLKREPSELMGVEDGRQFRSAEMEGQEWEYGIHAGNEASAAADGRFSGF